MSYNDIPSDVMWVWSIGFCKIPVGSNTMDKITKIIADNPKYFEWEHLYKDIPSKVHEAYKKEAFPFLYDEIGIVHGEGIAEYINSINVEPLTAKSFDKFWKDLADKEVQDDIDAKIQYVKDKKLWDKHYSKYKLKYKR